MDAWTGAPFPAQLLKRRTPLEIQGALVFKAKQCRNCHQLGDAGGMRGPALDDVAVQLTGDLSITRHGWFCCGRGSPPVNY
jgi:ubiquinol-cytochrome c reductase cytochrome b subunit